MGRKEKEGEREPRTTERSVCRQFDTQRTHPAQSRPAENKRHVVLTLLHRPAVAAMALQSWLLTHVLAQNVTYKALRSKRPRSRHRDPIGYSTAPSLRIFETDHLVARMVRSKTPSKITLLVRTAHRLAPSRRLICFCRGRAACRLAASHTGVQTALRSRRQSTT